MPAYDFANVMAEMGDFDSWGFKMALMPSNVNKKARFPRSLFVSMLIFYSNFEPRSKPC